jgi:predicted  nucleic acid-binding Zn-ribbon protein
MDIYLKKLQADYDSIVKECIDKDRRIADMEYKIKDLQYQVKQLNDRLKVKIYWNNFDADGRC